MQVGSSSPVLFTSYTKILNTYDYTRPYYTLWLYRYSLAFHCASWRVVSSTLGNIMYS